MWWINAIRSMSIHLVIETMGDNPANQVSLSTNFSMDGAEELTALSASQCQLIISILHSHALGSQPSS